MGAASVTGKGLGESLGEYKPENVTGCCGGRPAVESTPTVRNTNCSTRYSTGGITRYKTASSSSIKVCR